jgi:hypothetical protein
VKREVGDVLMVFLGHPELKEPGIIDTEECRMFSVKRVASIP